MSGVNILIGFVGAIGFLPSGIFLYLTTRPGTHRMHDSIEVFYLAHYPKHNTVKGAWKSYGFLVFVIIIAVWVLYMAYKLYEMENP